MWLDIIKERRKELGYTIKYVAQKATLPERTVSRIFSGETMSPSIDTLYGIAVVLELSLDEILTGGNAVVSSKNYAMLQEENTKLLEKLEILSSELTLVNAEASVLKDKIGVLSAENDILKIKLEHKEEIIAIHNYYIKMRSTE